MSCNCNKYCRSSLDAALRYARKNGLYYFDDDCKENIGELTDFDTDFILNAVENYQKLEAENKHYREALALIVADSCSLQPSSKFMSETALKALEQSDETK